MNHYPNSFYLLKLLITAKLLSTERLDWAKIKSRRNQTLLLFFSSLHGLSPASMCVCVYDCSLFMARNQLSLAHNGNVNGPERVSPTQGENWLGVLQHLSKSKHWKAGSRVKILPCLLSLDSPILRLSLPPSLPLSLPSSLERFTALPECCSNRSSEPFSLAIWKAYSPAYAAHARLRTRCWVQQVGDAAHIMTDDILHTWTPQRTSPGMVRII